MLKNYISVALLFAVCWSFNAEAVMGMSASKALSYSNVVRGSSSTGSSNAANTTINTNKKSEGNGVVKAKKTPKTEKTPSTHMVTMSNQDTSTIETKFQTLKAGDFLNVMLPSFSWAVDMGSCEGSNTVTNNRISFQIFGTKDSQEDCQIKFYGFNQDTSQILNKILNLTVEPK